MKFTILVEMLFDLLSMRKITAKWFSEKFHLSPRTVYRYIDVLSACLPIQIKRGRDGGIVLSAQYKLPKNFMTKEEYDALMQSAEEAYARHGDARFLSAKRKLSCQVKEETHALAHSLDYGTFLTDGGVFGTNPALREKLCLLEDSVKNRIVLEINSGNTVDKIEPHLLLFRRGIWYLYAFCHTNRAFRLFPLSDITFCSPTQQLFRRRPFSRENIPLDFFIKEENMVRVRLEIAKTALPSVREKLGRENVYTVDKKHYAELLLPDDETLVNTVLSLGDGVTLIYPQALKNQMENTLKTMLYAYTK